MLELEYSSERAQLLNSKDSSQIECSIWFLHQRAISNCRQYCFGLLGLNIYIYIFFFFCLLNFLVKLVEQFMTEDVQIDGDADQKLQSQLYIGKST